MTYEQLKKANEAIQTIDIQGKQYAEVAQRIKAFRMCFPEGLIKTEMVSLENGVVIFRAEVYTQDGGLLLSTGTAYEKENSTFINKTSFIENGESSAIGRALGIAGFGVDVALSSADEKANAIANEEHPKAPKKPDPEADNKKAEATPKATPEQIKIIREAYGNQCEKMLEVYKLEKLEDMNAKIASNLVKKVKERTQK